MTFFKVLTGILLMNRQDILSVFNASHESIDSVINPKVNDGNRTPFATSLQRMVSTCLHDNEPSANCNEKQAVEGRRGRTFAENCPCAEHWWWCTTGYDHPQYQLEQLFLEHQEPQVRWCTQQKMQLSRPGGAGGAQSFSLRWGLGRWCPCLQVEGLWQQVKELQEEVSRLCIRDD